MENNKYLILIIIAFLSFSKGYSQTGKVGINTTNPTENLDVNGETNTQKLFLRNPGNPTQTSGFFLGDNPSATNIPKTLDRLNPATAPMGIFNYIKLKLQNVNPNGVTDFDTKIDASRFVLVVHSFGIESVRTSNGVVSGRVSADFNGDNIGNNVQGSPVFQSFISGGTWHVRGRIDQSKFIPVEPVGGISTAPHTYNINFYMIAYYQPITKSNIPNQGVNAGGTDGSGSTISKPTGF